MYGWISKVNKTVKIGEIRKLLVSLVTEAEEEQFGSQSPAGGRTKTNRFSSDRWSEKVPQANYRKFF